LPSGPEPAGGWPVAIYGLPTSNDKNQAPLFVAATMAEHGIATIAINPSGMVSARSAPSRSARPAVIR
jgi:hypothetical protein